MKIAFIIDKTQTLPTILKVLKLSLRKGHDCTLYCCFTKEDLGSASDYLTQELIEKIKWVYDSDRNLLVKALGRERNNYDAVFGINFFNSSLNPIYKNSRVTNYSFEYCWNEIYNQVESFESEGTIFSNTEYSKKAIIGLSGYKKVISLGSPWFEFLSENKAEPKRKIVFMAPHNSFYQHKRGLHEDVKNILKSVRSYCDTNETELWLKTRSKYSNVEKQYVNFDNIVSDRLACSNIDTYKDSCLVINFCSSAVNELAYLEVPYLIIGPEIQRGLHTNRRCSMGIQKLHNQYYSGNIIDNTHCASLSLENNFGFNLVTSKIDMLINSTKDWSNFQINFFDKNHIGSSDRILRYVENEVAKSKPSDFNK